MTDKDSKFFDELHEIGIALAAEKNLSVLLELILTKSRSLLNADAGSIFLAEGPREKRTHLIFKVAQNSSVPIEFKEVTIPMTEESLAGFVAKTRKSLWIDDVHHLPTNVPYRFFSAMDQKSGYRSKSLLSVPMEDHRGDLIGVVQIWNKLSPLSKEVKPFTNEDLKVLRSLAAQAGISVENANLYDEITSLFKGFVRASVQTIESRDPTTAGHSERVAKLTVSLAKAVDQTESGPYKSVRFSPKELNELDVASLLHDFGKIGVPEAVLLKSKKLYPYELELFQTRIELKSRAIEIEASKAWISHLEAGGKRGDKRWLAIEKERDENLKVIEKMQRVVERSNEPTVLTEETSSELMGFKNEVLVLSKGRQTPLLTEPQILQLVTRKGSLSESERKVIQSHVTHTYRFLKEIPWTGDMKMIPEIAYAHHEKLDGSGYPRGISSEQIPLPSKIMAIADIFDALTARDRPYKRAIPASEALDFLDMEVKGGQLDAELFRLFVEAKVYEQTLVGD